MKYLGLKWTLPTINIQSKATTLELIRLATNVTVHYDGEQFLEQPNWYGG